MSAADGRLLGSRVHDREDDDPDAAVIVALPGAPADEWDINDDQTVADHPTNDGYPGDAPVVVVVFADELADHGLDDYDGSDELDLADLAETGVEHYAFPAPRLEVVGMVAAP